MYFEEFWEDHNSWVVARDIFLHYVLLLRRKCPVTCNLAAPLTQQSKRIFPYTPNWGQVLLSNCKWLKKKKNFPETKHGTCTSEESFTFKGWRLAINAGLKKV
jgi:hypothetical protein